MRLWYNHVLTSRAYQQATARERRTIEIRFCLARTIKAARRTRRVTQQQLASRLGISRTTISKVERASNRVTIDVALQCMIELGLDDAAIAAPFNAGLNPGIAIVRRRADAPFFPKPRADGTPPPEPGHRFYCRRVASATRTRADDACSQPSISGNGRE